MVNLVSRNGTLLISKPVKALFKHLHLIVVLMKECGNGHLVARMIKVKMMTIGHLICLEANGIHFLLEKKSSKVKGKIEV